MNNIIEKKEPKYLMKFVSENDYADMFINGKLYTNAADYYCYLEQGRGDKKEGNVLHKPLDYTYKNWDMCFKKCVDYPIYCMYTVFSEDICNGVIYNIDRRCIADFSTENGYVVLISYSDMLSVIKSCCIENAEIIYKNVEYRQLTFDDEIKFLFTKSLDNLFIKEINFSYQKEFRIVICQQVFPEICVCSNGAVLPKYQPQIYKFAYNIKEKAKKHKISDFQVQDENNLYLII